MISVVKKKPSAGALLRWSSGVFLVIALTLATSPPVTARQQGTGASASDKWEKDIAAFEEQDRKSPPPADAALFIGSSSFRLWTNLAQDFSEIPVINRGFGGSEIADSTHYVDRIVLPYKPRLIVMFAGTNDIAGGKQPEQVLKDFQEFVSKVRAGLPGIPIAYVSMNQTLSRWHLRDKMSEANRLIQKYTRTQRGLTFLDSATPLLGPDGKPQKSLLREDELHLNAEGYKAWKAIIKPPILKLYRRAKPAVSR